MKTNRGQGLARSGFTLTEMMVASTLVTMLICGVIIGHLAGVRMFQYTRTKLGGNDDARSAISRMIEEVRSAKIVRVGNGDDTGFRECADGTPQQGNALQIYATSDSNVFSRYFLASDTTLRRLTSASGSAPVIANYVTNQLVFTSEDYSGVVLTNNENNRVIGLTLQFYQIQYPIVRVGPNEMYDFYQLRTKITRRALE